jgi:hypothetical protein
MVSESRMVVSIFPYYRQKFSILPSQVLSYEVRRIGKSLIDNHQYAVPANQTIKSLDYAL